MPTGPETAQPPATAGRFARPIAPNAVTCPEDNAACEPAVRALLSDAARAWVERPAKAQDYVSGARLVAYDQLRADLTCKELLIGIQEAQTAVLALGAAVADEKALNRDPSKLQAVADMAGRVERRLTSTREQKC
ncbi:MAG: hypothetical protein AAFY53_09730 [Pseudomonadota bacterium]